MKKVTEEQAQKEFDQWLNYKKVKDSKREDHAEFGAMIIEAITDGQIIVKENNLVFTPSFPVEADGGKVVLEKLTFAPRIRVRDLNAKMKGVKSTDGDGRIMAYIAASTNENTGMLGNLDTSDYSICQAIAMYFL